MFEMARDYVRQNTDFEIVGGYLSPVSDMYKKPGLLSAQHRFVPIPIYLLRSLPMCVDVSVV